MADPRYIWDHEKKTAAKIAARLLEETAASAEAGFFKRRKRLSDTRQNLLFTKKLAFEAAKRIASGADHGEALAQVGSKTEGILVRDKRGYYTEKIRRRQLQEVAFLMDHYLLLLKGDEKGYEAQVRSSYGDREAFEDFSDRLRELEGGVIRATLSSLKKGSRKERSLWFSRLSRIVEEVCQGELDQLFPD